MARSHTHFIKKIVCTHIVEENEVEEKKKFSLSLSSQSQTNIFSFEKCDISFIISFIQIWAGKSPPCQIQLGSLGHFKGPAEKH